MCEGGCNNVGLRLNLQANNRPELFIKSKSNNENRFLIVEGGGSGLKLTRSPLCLYFFFQQLVKKMLCNRQVLRQVVRQVARHPPQDFLSLQITVSTCKVARRVDVYTKQ